MKGGQEKQAGCPGRAQQVRGQGVRAGCAGGVQAVRAGRARQVQRQGASGQHHHHPILPACRLHRTELSCPVISKLVRAL